MSAKSTRRYFLTRSSSALAAAFLGNHVALATLLASLQAPGLATPHSESSDAEMIELAKTEKGLFCDTPKKVGAAADVIFLCVGDTAMTAPHRRALTSLLDLDAGRRKLRVP